LNSNWSEIGEKAGDVLVLEGQALFSPKLLRHKIYICPHWAAKIEDIRGSSSLIGKISRLLYSAALEFSDRLA
jgi:hypothetical protein